MKKTFLLLLSAALLAALMGCQKPNEELPPVMTDETTAQATETEKTPPKDTEAQTEAETEPQTEPIPDLETESQTNPETEAQVSPEIETPNQSEDQYCAASIYDNVNEYLQDVWEQQYGQSGAGNVNGNNNSVATMVPVLKKADYEFGGFDKMNPRLSWAYLPSDRTEVNHYEFIYVYTYFSGATYETMIEKYDPPIMDERYGAVLIFDTWYFIVDGYCIAVMLPVTMTDEEIASFDTVLEYFDFEIVTYSPTAETEQLPQNDDQYSAYTGISNIEVILRDLWEHQAEQEGDVGLNSQNHAVSVLLPVLKNDDYECIKLSNPVTGENGIIRWDYKRTGQYPRDPYDRVTVEVYLGIPDHDEFIRNQIGLLILDEEYHAGFQTPTWFFQMEGYTVSVRMPYTELEGSEWVPLERVFEYFDFEIVTYSPTAETNPVQ